MSAPRILSLDFETASQADLRRTGSATYSEHPSTRVLCLAYAFDNDPVQIWRIGEPFPQGALDHCQNMHPVRAWNAAFEFNIWNNTLLRQLRGAGHGPLVGSNLEVNQMRDTMAQAAYYGLPLSLDMAAQAARLPISKSKAGHSLMLRMCRPRGVDTATGAPIWWHETDPVKLDELCAYCVQDVEVERALANMLPTFPAAEQRVWELDQRMNQRGVGVDYTFVEKMKALAMDAALATNTTLAQITSGVVKTVNSTKPMLELLRSLGYPHDNLRKGVVAERLDAMACEGLERDILELRADGAKTSAAKLDAMLGASVTRGGVGRVRGMLQYYGAFRTGRWAGRLIQLQNMPRGTLSASAVDAAVKAVLAGASLATMALLFGSGMTVVSSLLRSCIVAPSDQTLSVADFAQIEARVLPWLAGQQDVLDVFRSGEDVYVQAAAGIFGVPPHLVTKDQRQIGKVAILALGFGGGKGAFKTMAAIYGLDVTDERAEEIKVAWRAANSATVNFWWALDRACRHVLTNPNSVVPVGPHIKVGRVNAHLVIVLPSNRALFYRDAKLVANPDRPGQDDITYMGMNQYTRKWERIRTYGGKLAENVTQAVARDVMAHAMVQCENEGMTLVLTVHDELLAENSSLDRMLEIMRTPPAWASDLPVGAEGWEGPRYKKG